MLPCDAGTHFPPINASPGKHLLGVAVPWPLLGGVTLGVVVGLTSFPLPGDVGVRASPGNEVTPVDWLKAGVPKPRVAARTAKTRVFIRRI